MKTLTPAEAAQIQATLALARQGRATLVQLAVAHDLASGAGLNGTLGELRAHMRQMITPPPLHDSSKHIVLGVISGILTHYVLD
jgi:hypothetical protein